MTEVLLAVAVGLLGCAIWLQLRGHALVTGLLAQLRFWKQGAGAARAPLAAGGPSTKAGEVVAAPATSIAGAAPGHLAVLDAQQLLQVTSADRLLAHVARHSKVSREVYERDLLPALLRLAEFVQLLPASESHHHANVGGLLAHAMETVHHALVLRAGYVLPRDGGAEVVDAQRDYWTYAIFIGALLHDVGKPLTDLRVEMRLPQSSSPVRWLPLSGSMLESRAEQYLVNFAPKAERDYGAHGKLGVVLMQRLVPASALAFLGRCPAAFHELGQFLSGDARQGVIAEIVSKADALSTKNNLSSGNRARFATAKNVPLVEQLMGALQEMLRHGGYLPLNRDGAVGWVFDGSIWFVAKRLADTTREFIVSRAGEDAGIPGENKNDRLFDTWQEYGQLMPNPATGQAIWHVTVHGQDGQGGGYQHTFSMLRFALEKLFPGSLANAPAPMIGHIEVLAKRKADAGEAAAAQSSGEDRPHGAAVPNAPTASSTMGRDAGIPIAAPAARASENAAVIPIPPVAAPISGKSLGLPANMPNAAAEIPAPRFGERSKPKPKATQAALAANTNKGVPPAPAAIPDSSDELLPAEACAPNSESERKSPQTAALGQGASPDAAHATGRSQANIKGRAPAGGGWSPLGAAPRVPFQSGHDPDDQPEAAPNVPIAAARAPSRVVLHDAFASITNAQVGKGTREPSEHAVAFMRWVQTGLNSGALKYNEAGAPVHFVDAGIALVSPAIFREYATERGEPEATAGSGAKTGPDRVGLSIQREVLRAGWHLPSPADGTNIWTFNVSRRGGSKTSKLSAVVLANAQRWIIEPPPSNPSLQLPKTSEVQS